MNPRTTATTLKWEVRMAIRQTYQYRRRCMHVTVSPRRCMKCGERGACATEACGLCGPMGAAGGSCVNASGGLACLQLSMMLGRWGQGSYAQHEKQGFL